MQLINATEARRNFFSILDEVYFDGKEIVIEKGNRVKVKIIPVMAPKIFDFAKYRENIIKIGKIFSDEDVRDFQKTRKSMDRDLENWQ